MMHLLMVIPAVVLNQGFGWPLPLAAVVSLLGWTLIGGVLSAVSKGDAAKDGEQACDTQTPAADPPADDNAEM